MKKIFLLFFLFGSAHISLSQSEPLKLKICDAEMVDRNIPEADYKAVLKRKCGEGVEAWSQSDSAIVMTSFHPFVEAVHYAYSYHRPLVITPDMIWLMIAQGFAKHVDNNAEELRDQLVDFEGKKVLKVRRDGFQKGSTDNNWEGVFPEFTAQIANYTGQDLLNTTVHEFSTTTPATKAAMEVTLMDAMSSFFILAVYSDCAITEIWLEGTPEDWKEIRESAKNLRPYKLDWWIDELDPVLENFVKASEGAVDTDFWGQIYKRYSPGSGATTITGWINKFFPYIKRQDKVVQRTNLDGALTTENYLSGMSKADFYWIYFGTTYQMEFLAGFNGIQVDPETKALKPEIGWAIRDTGEQGIKETDSLYKKDILTPP